LETTFDLDGTSMVVTGVSCRSIAETILWPWSRAHLRRMQAGRPDVRLYNKIVRDYGTLNDGLTKP